MRKLLSLILILLLAIPVFGASAEMTPVDGMDGVSIVSSPEAGFSTLIDFDCRAEFKEGDGVYFHLGEDNMPYVLVSVDRSGNRVTDPDAYFNEELVPRLRQTNSPNGAFMSTVHGDGRLNGQTTPVLEMQYYNSQGIKIYFIAVFDVQTDYTVYYRVRYVDEAEQMPTLAAMQTICDNLRPDANYYLDMMSGRGTGGGADPGAAMTFKVTSVVSDGMVLGRVTAPSDYEVSAQVSCCTAEQSAGNPWQVAVTALSPDAATMMSYVSIRDFYAEGADTSQDGVFSLKYFTPILHYMTAAEYCDFWASTLNSTNGFALVEEKGYPELQSILNRQAQAFKDSVNSQMNGLGLTAERTDYTVAERRYALTAPNGVDYYFVISTVTRGTLYRTFMPGLFVNQEGHYILWDAPYVYSMLCPVDQWDQASAMFAVFTENTSVSDQFLLANQRLSTEIWSSLTGIDLVGGKEIGERIMREETSAGDDYDEERFTDYIFDANDYTLSDGSHVKVSTAYDHVYEGDNGVVYYSDSAFAQPGGSTELTPNR